jgi:hypothetical protein
MLIATRRSNGLGYRPQRPKPFLVKRRGMGDCTTIPGSNFVRDNATGNVISYDAKICGAGAGSQPSNSATYIPAGPANFATMPFGNSTTTTFTLESYLQQRVASLTGVSTLSLANEGINPSNIPAWLAESAQQYCQAESPPDCGNISSLVAKYAAQAVAAFANVPASQWNPDTYTPYAYSGPQNNPPQGSPSPTGGLTRRGGSPAASAAPVTVSMNNITRPGSDTSYSVGDQWQITLTGAPGTAVSASASQNGKSLGTTPFGSLNAQGQMVLTGTMGADQTGSWSESWNGAPVSFTVTAGGSTVGISKTTGAGDNQQLVSGSGFALPAMPDLSSLPSWTWYAVGGVVLWMMVKK